MNARWLEELERPTEAFFEVFAQRINFLEGPEDAVREAVEFLVPRVDWAAYQPQVPHGLLGLWAVLRLRPLLSGTGFRRVLATQLHAFAHEVRAPKPRKLPTFGQGSGHWGNLRLAVETHRPSMAWGEAVGTARPEAKDFRRLGDLVAADMACVGHKPVMLRCLGELHGWLGSPPGAGRRLLGIGAWLAAGPADTFWIQRIRHRVPEGTGSLADEACLDAGARTDLARTLCEVGLVELLDCFTQQVRSGVSAEDLRALLARAAAWKQLDARRDLEGKTAWNFLYLATVDAREAASWNPEPWLQAAALIHLFPSDEESVRSRPRPPVGPATDPAEALLEAILDGEAPEAMHCARHLWEDGEGDRLMAVLAEAASQNDPIFNQSSHLLAAASVADLAPRLPADEAGLLLQALAKLLANSQGSCDLGRKAEAHFR